MRGRRTPAPDSHTSVPAPLSVILATHFPVARHLGVRVREASARRVILEAPLAPNRNRSGTAFAGSLNALATLAGWSWVTLCCRGVNPEPQILLQDSSIHYEQPARSAFRAVCVAPDAQELERFRSTLHRRGRARVRVGVTLLTSTGSVGTFTGRYVASR